MRDSGSPATKRITFPPDSAIAHPGDGAEPAAGARL
jgi:hypothetical protein